MGVERFSKSFNEHLRITISAKLIERHRQFSGLEFGLLVLQLLVLLVLVLVLLVLVLVLRLRLRLRLLLLRCLGFS